MSSTLSLCVIPCSLPPTKAASSRSGALRSWTKPSATCWQTTESMPLARSRYAGTDTHFEDALTHDFQPLVAKMRNHPKDCHVAACAVAGKASLIVTSNIRDFERLPEGISAVTPDEFLLRLMAETPDMLRAALDAQSARLKRKPMDVATILGLLRIVAPKFVATWLDGS